MKHVKGDKAIVREDLVHDNIYGGRNINYEMMDLGGTQVTIEYVHSSAKHYTIKESIHCWTDEMFEDIESEQEINYMMVWDENEKEATKENVYADLTDNTSHNGEYPIKTLKNGGVARSFKHCKSIEEWKKDTGFLFENSLHEKFFSGDIVYWVIKEKNTLAVRKINAINVYRDNAANSEIMTKGSAEKYIKEHEVKYRPFTQEEFKEHRNKWLKHIQGSSSEYRITKTESDYIYVSGSRCTYMDLLDSYVFEDGTPCGVILK